MADLWDPDIDFGLADAARLLGSQFPSLRGASLTEFGKGWDNRLYLANDEWVLRFPVRHIAAPLIESELVALPYLAPLLPLPVPVPELIGRSDGEYPFTWMGYRRLEGEVLCRLDPPPATNVLAAQLGEFLAALHGADPAGVALPEDAFGKAVLSERYDQLAERVERMGGEGLVDSSTLDALLGQAGDLAQSDPWPHPSRIVHGDLYGYHLLSDGDAVVGVIDWGDVHRGDPALDLSIAFAWFEAPQRQVLFEAYGTIDEATLARARFRALYYAGVLIRYGRDVGDAGVELTGRRALGAIRA